MPIFFLEIEKRYEVTVEAPDGETLEQAALTLAEAGEIDREWGGPSWQVSAGPALPPDLCEGNPECGLIDGDILAWEDYVKAKKGESGGWPEPTQRR